MQTFCVCGDKLWHYDAVSFFGSRVSFCPPRRRSRVVSMVAKRSPKRLKYTSASRFTKEDGLVHIEADPSASDSWKLEPIVNLLKQGAVGVIPTDTMYSIVCDLRSHSAIERLRRIKNIEASKPLSILCHSFRDIDKYTAGFPRGDGQGHANLFKAVKQYLPGPDQVDSLGRPQGQDVSLGMAWDQDDSLGKPQGEDDSLEKLWDQYDISGKVARPSCIKFQKEDEWMIDPVTITDTYGPEGLDFVVDGGVRVADPSTVVDMTKMPPKVLRQGKFVQGPILHWMELEDDQKTDVDKDLIPAGI
ncbi:hypothetical protein D0Y65_042807 [Glycine soja]|uniref:Threonylcarbamoyl-AMP synthase n=1 Tax=Glycine soja TaxID=3848 RepID=A0A445GEZ8_GLYSO|nr:hypothetical protein D0Y65_042807 [Glycine soja]